MIEVDEVCDLAASLPEAVEGTWYGAPAFRVRGKVFARVHENDPDLFLMKVGADERDALVAAEPGRFRVTDHRPERGDSVLMSLAATSAGELAEVHDLLRQAWRRVAPPKLVERAGI